MVDRGSESFGFLIKGVPHDIALCGRRLRAHRAGPCRRPDGHAHARADQETKPAAAQKIDEEYTKIITQDLQDPRITTELVDHLPASATVPTPLKFLGRAVGTPGELTYAKDIYRYYEALAKASPRAKFWKIGTTEEGRDMVVLAIADEATIKQLDKYKDMLAALGDPRKTTEAQAQQLLKTAKPIYYITSGIHSPETGGPEMLIELAYRLIVEETPFIQNIRNNVITFITPVVEVDGREKEVDTYYFNKTRKPGDARLPLMYWGKYVQHDNNRDGMGQFLKLTQNITKTTLEWHPTVLHDLHEAQTYLYASTGTGPYNDSLDPISVDEWWMLAENDVMEMAKRGVPGVWTYGFYDGWVPNYLFWIAQTHNALGRFYEVQSYGPDPYEVRPPATTTSKEWFRPNPPLPLDQVGAAQQHEHPGIGDPLRAQPRRAQPRSLSRQLLAEEQALGRQGQERPGLRLGDSGRAAAQGRHGRRGERAAPPGARGEPGDVGLHGRPRCTSTLGDYVVRADQPYRTLADMYFSIQNYPPQNPPPYDDTGWTFQLMRDIEIRPVTDKSLLDQPMTLVASDVKAPGGIEGTGPVIVVDDTADNSLVTFRFKNAGVKMLAAEEDFELDHHAFRAGAIIVPERRSREARADAEGSRTVGVGGRDAAGGEDARPRRAAHRLRAQLDAHAGRGLVARGARHLRHPVHVLRRSEAEGGQPAREVRRDHLPARRRQPAVAGQRHADGRQRSAAVQEDRQSSRTSAYVDSSDDIRGGMGLPGLLELAKFVEEGGTLITDGSTTTIFPEYGITSGVTVEHPAQLFVRGSILRAKIADPKSPIAYGYEGTDLPVYFNQDPVLNAGGGGIPPEFAAFFGGGPANAGLGQNITPNAVPVHVSPWDAGRRRREGGDAHPAVDEVAAFRQMARQFGISFDTARPRVVVRFPSNPDEMLLSGTLANGQFLANRAAARRRAARQGARRHVRVAAVLALADAGDLFRSASTRS